MRKRLPLGPGLGDAAFIAREAARRRMDWKDGKHRRVHRSGPQRRARGETQPSNFLTTTVALCPPKPKLLLIATRTFASRAVCGT